MKKTISFNKKINQLKEGLSILNIKEVVSQMFNLLSYLKNKIETLEAKTKETNDAQYKLLTDIVKKNQERIKKLEEKSGG